MFGEMKVVVTEMVTQEKINWPVKRRSRRLHKKLTKKLGPQFTREPGALQTPYGLIVHPVVWGRMKAKIDGGRADG